MGHEPTPLFASAQSRCDRRSTAFLLASLLVGLSSCSDDGSSTPARDAAADGTGEDHDGAAIDGPAAADAGVNADGAGMDGGPASDGGTPFCDPALAIDAPEETWTYVEIPGSECANGTPAGIGVNRTSRSERLLIYFKGGGACFSDTDCAASDLDGFSASKLASQTSGNRLFDRTSSSNPFRDFDYVFIPYCTGDFHSGANVAESGRHHVGFRNVQRYLERVVPTFCDAAYVLVTGTSAGGFGATFNYEQVHEAFGPIPVDLLDDSGPYMRSAYMPAAIQDLTAASWGWRANVPAGCSECATSWHALYSHAATRYPDDRISLVTALRDPSIQRRFGRYGGITTLDEFQSGVVDLTDEVLVPLPNARVFHVDEQGHVWTTGRLDNVVVGGTSLQTFIEQQMSDDPAWASVRP